MVSPIVIFLSEKISARTTRGRREAAAVVSTGGGHPEQHKKAN